MALLHRRISGLTLLELLVVLTVVVVLAALLLPGLGRVRSRCGRVTCKANLNP